MNHKGTVTLTTERLFLRRFTLDDAEAVFRNWTRDPEVTKYARQMPHTSLDEAEKYCADIINSYQDSNFYYWAIVNKGLNEPIGRINITQQNETVEMVHVSFMIGRRWWNKGALRC